MFKLIRYCEYINEWIGRSVCWLLPVFITLTFGIVVLRYGFQYGRVDLQEAVVYMHAATVALCMAYTLRNEGHVRVDVFYNKMTDKAKTWINLLGDIFFLLPTCAAIFIYSFDYVSISWQFLEHSQEASGLPLVFLLKSLIPAMAVLLFFQGLTWVIYSLYVITRNNR